MTVQVFIENQAGTNIKNLHDEKRLTFKKSVVVSRNYPYPYGFILDTTSGDGDNLDVFILTDQKLKRGDIVTAEVIGLMRQIESEQEDFNVIAVLKGESTQLDDKTKQELTDFVEHVFDHLDIKIRIEGFADKDAAESYVLSSQQADLSQP